MRSLLSIEEEEAGKLRSQRPLRGASFIADLTNEGMAPYAEQFWVEVPQWLRDSNVLPTDYGVIKGLGKVEEINEALDSYREFTRAGPQMVVKVEE